MQLAHKTARTGRLRGNAGPPALIVNKGLPDVAGLVAEYYAPHQHVRCRGLSGKVEPGLAGHDYLHGPKAGGRLLFPLPVTARDGARQPRGTRERAVIAGEWLPRAGCHRARPLVPRLGAMFRTKSDCLQRARSGCKHRKHSGLVERQFFGTIADEQRLVGTLASKNGILAVWSGRSASCPT